MPTTTEHYSAHLAPVYAWMAGGIDAALEAGARDIESLDLPSDRKFVIDLGAGFGMHAIPLARLGYSVLAIDSSAELLSTLSQQQGSLPIKAIQDDLLQFAGHLVESPGAILCMGDTLTHLPDQASIDTLIQTAATALRPGGILVFTFRDYSNALVDEKRFIPVRSDDNRILTCFLEYEEHSVKVHDILHERSANGWQLKVSWYRKLRLNPDDIAKRVAASGFEIRQEIGTRGMVRVIARRM